MAEWTAVDMMQVAFEGGFWGPILETNRSATLEAVTEHCHKVGGIRAFSLAAAGDAEDHVPHQFHDSDVAKWFEGAACILAARPEPGLRKNLTEFVDQVAAAQQPDGYLNTFFTLLRPEQRFTNLRDMHELYCAGHLIEAAVAWQRATGESAFVETMLRYVDLIAATLGHGPGQIPGYGGHEELELALLKLYRLTGRQTCLDLARYLIDERGREPFFFDQEAAARGDNPGHHDASYYQAHRPVRQQRQAEGHAVRALYLYCGMADLASLDDDGELLEVCRTLWISVTRRRMYLTGGVGSCHVGEVFTFDHDLPNEQAYAETCAAIALVLFAHRMLHADQAAGLNCDYADVMERALYNGVLSGVSLDGRSFFYDNYLASKPPYHRFHRRRSPERQPWFNCACCPTNMLRLLASLGDYAASASPEGLAVHLYVQGRIAFQADGVAATLRITGDYPWSETITLELGLEAPAEFDLLLRVPGWCDAARIAVGGETLSAAPGYARLRRRWRDSERIELTLPMPPRRVYAHPGVRHDAGRTALMRGPLVYCLEQVDNGPDLNALALARGATLTSRHDASLLGGATVIEAEATRLETAGWDDALYRAAPPQHGAASLRFVPYARWANRGGGEMLIWVHEDPA